MSRFDKMAKEWDLNPRRVRVAKSVTSKIKELIDIKDFEICDFGAGTGLISFNLFEEAKSITAVDNSKGMLKELETKAKKANIKNIKPLNLDIEKEHLPKESFDLIVSSMTMHHIKDTKLFLKKLKSSLKKGGYIAISDLIKEDGTFHTKGNDGVYHYGFSKDELVKIFEKLNIKVIDFSIVEVIKKHRDFEVFLIVGMV